MKLGIDCDGVLCNFIDAYKQLIIKITGVDLFLVDMQWNSWDFDKKCGYTNKDHLNKVWDYINNSISFWNTLPAYEDASEVLLQLWGRVLKGDDLYFVTSRPGNSTVTPKLQTEGWLNTQFLWRSWHQFTPTVLITSQKGDAAALLELDYYIDDRWENCLDVLDKAPWCNVYLMDRPWNAGKDNPQIKRVKSVMEMLKEVE